MRSLPTEIQALLARRDGIITHRLFLLTARDRTTGAMAQIGIWSGPDHRDFVIDGVTTTFYGAGDFLTIDSLKTDRGLTIRKLSMNMSPFTTEVQLALKQYDPKFAPVKVYLSFFDPLTNNPVADPWRVFKGWVDTAPQRQGEKNGKSQAIINAVGHTRILTRVFPSKRSDASQKKRSGGDTFFSSVGITGTIITPWGTAK